MTREEALAFILNSWDRVVDSVMSIPQTGWEAVAAVSTALAALFAAYSAWTSRGSAKAARDAVDEARLARKEERAPRLVLERDFLDFEFVWPHPDSLNGEPVFLARRHWKDKEPVPPTFSLTNHGGGPAVELQIVFELDDPNGELVVPEMFTPLGLSVTEEEATRDGLRVKFLNCHLPNGRGGGLPMYRRSTVDISNCVPGQTRTIEFPMGPLSRLLLRGLQYWERRGEEDGLKPVVVTVSITYHTIDGDLEETQFRFEAFPFWQGEHNPLRVAGHFHELPMYPKPDKPRVA